MFKAQKLFTSSFILNTTIFTHANIIKTHTKTFAQTKKLLKMPSSLKPGLIKTVSVIWA
jgi:hypothetical protein